MCVGVTCSFCVFSGMRACRASSNADILTTVIVLINCHCLWPRGVYYSASTNKPIPDQLVSLNTVKYCTFHSLSGDTIPDLSA